MNSPDTTSPAPERTHLRLGFVALSDAAPLAVGAKRAVTWLVAPGAKVNGPAGEAVNIALELVIDVTVRVPSPALETVIT